MAAETMLGARGKKESRRSNFCGCDLLSLPLRFLILRIAAPVTVARISAFRSNASSIKC